MHRTATKPTLGGLPPERFIGRLIKVKWGDRFQHPSACKCVAVDGDEAVVSFGVRGVEKYHRVSLSRCRPWWTHSPDLKAEAESLGAEFSGQVSVGRAFVEAEKPAVVTVSPVIQPTEEPPVVTPTTPLPRTDLASGPEADAPRHASRLEVPLDGEPTWLSDLQEYYHVRSALKGNEKKLDELRNQVEEERIMLGLLEEQLRQYGVVFRYEGEETTTTAEKPFREKEEILQDRLRTWLRQRQAPFDFPEIFAALGTEDNAQSRRLIKRRAERAGFTYATTRPGPGSKTVFRRA